jgi:osmotically-inducible protein OsmY
MRLTSRAKQLTQSTVLTIAAALPLCGVADDRMTDENIARAVETELAFSDVIPIERVDVEVNDSIVSLTGTVSTLAAYRQAEDIAAIVKGVRGIVNRIDVDAQHVQATDVRTNVEEALAQNPATDAYEIEVRAATDGRVTLLGTVNSWAEKSLAETVASTVPGVRSITNELDVDDSRAYRGSEEIRADIAGRLHWDARVNASLIDILVRDGGRVTLSGTVGSLAEKRLAVGLAHVQGVRNVDADHLEVADWSNDEDLELGAEGPVSDADIWDAVSKALTYDPRVLSKDIDIGVTDGDVWLTGTAGNLTASRAAKEDAANTLGVMHVFNSLSVRPTELGDEDIAVLGRNALMANGELAGKGIELTVHAGRARLSGDVDNAEQYWRADEIVSNTRGVESLDNELTIRGEEPRFGSQAYMSPPRLLPPQILSSSDVSTDRTLHEAVGSEFFWSPFVDGSDIDIAVDDGVVTLTGTVDSTGEYVAAAENAFEAGALVVHNDLQIEPD